MLEIISILCLILALAVLVALIIIDLRTLILPNAFVLSFALLGALFHASTQFYYTASVNLALGALIGGVMLYLVRALGNAWYKTDTLGLGDIKLMAAGGLWLGMHDTLLAIIAGALCGLLHGAGLLLHGKIKSGKFPMLSTFSLPAGPGFIVGLIIIGVAKFRGLPHLSF